MIMKGSGSLSSYRETSVDVKSTGQLILALQKKYKIPGRNVVTHSDVCIGEKSDPGPMFPYKEIFEKYGAGYYPESRYINLDKFSKLTDKDYLRLLEIYGYNKGENGRAFELSDNQIVNAFKLHFYPGDLSEDLNDNTKKNDHKFGGILLQLRRFDNSLFGRRIQAGHGLFLV